LLTPFRPNYEQNLAFPSTAQQHPFGLGKGLASVLLLASIPHTEATERRRQVARPQIDRDTWQFGEDWEEILPPWFRILSATVAPGEYAERVPAMMKSRCSLESRNLLPFARRTAIAEQRKAFAGLERLEQNQSSKGRIR
jgi:hypothetical protein